MQVSVTYLKQRNNKRRVIKSIVSTILIFLFAIISSAILISVRRKTLMYEERVFYLVCAAREEKETLLDGKKELLKNLGAGNVIFKEKDKFYLVANVYLDIAFAEEIKDNLNGYFPDAWILRLKAKKIEINKIKKIKDNIIVEQFLKYMYQLSSKFQNLHMEYLVGRCEESEFIRYMLTTKLDLEKFASQMNMDGEFYGKFKEYASLVSLKLSNFLLGVDVARSKRNYVCNYFVSFYLDYIEFYASL